MIKNDDIKIIDEKLEFEALTEEINDFDIGRNIINFTLLFRALCSLLIFLVVAFSAKAMLSPSNIMVSSEDSIKLVSTPLATTVAKTGTISIPAGMVKANPFQPYKELTQNSVLDLPEYSLVEPPEVLNESSDAARIMDTTVSGILYDKFSPSAILNIEGSDYLVKKGDVVNNYKVLSIMPDSVTVKLGENVYKAGIGEILTGGALNYNEISNLDNKFGGVK